MKGSIKPAFYGFLLALILCSGLAGYWYFTQPKQAQPQQTEMQKWVAEHPKEVEWAKNRYDKFHAAADQAFMQDDVTAIKSSK